MCVYLHVNYQEEADSMRNGRKIVAWGPLGLWRLGDDDVLKCKWGPKPNRLLGLNCHCCSFNRITIEHF